MKEITNLKNKDFSLIVIPSVIILLFFLAIFATYIRVYKNSNIYYFFTEEEVDNFSPVRYFIWNQ